MTSRPWLLFTVAMMSMACDNAPAVVRLATKALGGGDSSWPYPIPVQGVRGSVRTLPAQGITYRSFTSAQPPFRAHYVEVDLATWAGDVLATAFADRAATTSAFAAANGCSVAINGGFFLSSMDAWGEAVGAGVPWPAPTPVRAEDNGFVALGLDEGMPRVLITDPRANAARRQPWMTAVVGGDPLLVENGFSRSGACSCPVADPVPSSDTCSAQTDGRGTNLGGRARCERRSRTGFGYRDQDGQVTLVFAVVERLDASNADHGATLAEFADFFASLRVTRALNLDGGGSTSMFFRGSGLVNQPTDAAGERVVANHLGICPQPRR
jgi:hypothetical protein